MTGFETHDPPAAGEDAEDRRLTALLAGARAGANPAVWARVRTRLAAAPAGRFEALVDWLARPVAAAAATATLLVSLGLGLGVVDTVVRSEGTSIAAPADAIAASEAASLIESLLEGNATTPAEADDAPRDSGGRS